MNPALTGVHERVSISTSRVVGISSVGGMRYGVTPEYPNVGQRLFSGPPVMPALPVGPVR